MIENGEELIMAFSQDNIMAVITFPLFGGVSGETASAFVAMLGQRQAELVETK